MKNIVKTSVSKVCLGISSCLIGFSPAELVISDQVGSVALYENDGTVLRNYATGLGNAQGVAVDDVGGFTYAADFNGSISRYNTVTGGIINTVSSTAGSLGLAMAGSSDLVAVLRGTNTNFVHFDPTGTDSVISLSPGFDPTYEGIALGGGVLFAANTAAGGLVQGFDATTGDYLGIANFDFSGPRGVAASADGNTVYVGDLTAGEIRVWDRVAGTTATFATLEGAFGVTIDPTTGDVWASSITTGKIVRYDSAGNELSSFTVPDGARYLAYTNPVFQDPRIVVAPSVTVAMPLEGGPISIPVSNQGSTETLRIDGIQLTGSDELFFQVSTSLPLDIPPGGQGTIELAFNPEGFDGEFNAGIEITSNDPSASTVSVNIEVMVAIPAIMVPASASFGPVAYDAPTQSFSMTVENTGAGELEIFSAAFIAGPVGATHFQQFALTHDFINDGSLFVAPGESTDLEFDFDPAGIVGGIATGVLEIASSDYNSDTVQVPVTIELTDPGTSPAQPELVHRWSFAADASDSAGGATALLQGGAIVSDGNLMLPGGEIRTNMAELPIGLTFARSYSMTLEAWVTPANETQTFSKIWMFGSPVGGPFESTYIDLTQTSPYPSVSFRTPARGEVVTRDEPNPSPLPAGVESHLVVVYDSENDLISLHRDGALIDSVPWAGEMHELGITLQNYLGAAVLFGDADWAGMVNEFRIWNGAFSATQVAASFSAGTETLPELDQPPAGNDGFAIGSISISNGMIVIAGIQGLEPGMQYHLETGVSLDDFAPVAGSTFTTGDPLPTVPADGPRRFVRVVEGAEP